MTFKVLAGRRRRGFELARSSARLPAGPRQAALPARSGRKTRLRVPLLRSSPTGSLEPSGPLDPNTRPCWSASAALRTSARAPQHEASSLTDMRLLLSNASPSRCRFRVRRGWLFRRPPAYLHIGTPCSAASSRPLLSLLRAAAPRQGLNATTEDQAGHAEAWASTLALPLAHLA